MSLAGCPISQSANYREQVFKLIPTLLILDGRDKNGDKIQDDNKDESDSFSSENEKVAFSEPDSNGEYVVQPNHDRSESREDSVENPSDEEGK